MSPGGATFGMRLPIENSWPEALANSISSTPIDSAIALDQGSWMVDRRIILARIGDVKSIAILAIAYPQFG